MLKHKHPIGTIAEMSGIPCLLTEYHKAFVRMFIYSIENLCTSNQFIHYLTTDVSYHQKARNELALHSKGNWTFFMDTDHMPDPDLLVRMLYLLNKYNIDVLTGIYQIKTFPYAPLLYVWNEDKTGFELIAEFDAKGAEILKIDAAAGGCLLVRNSVLIKILTEMDEQPFTITPPFSEDISFFVRLSKLNIPVYFAANIENPHLVIRTVTMKDKATEGFKTESRENEGRKI